MSVVAFLSLGFTLSYHCQDLYPLPCQASVLYCFLEGIVIAVCGLGDECRTGETIHSIEML